MLREIRHLRGLTDFVIDQRNSNRYQVIVKESVGQTAYCFSTPIYNTTTRQLVNMNFTKAKNGQIFYGTNGVISLLGNKCRFERCDGQTDVLLKDIPIIGCKKPFKQSDIMITPTLNGLRFIGKGKGLQFTVKSETKQHSIRVHSTCFSVMKEKYRPFLSVSALYATDGKGRYAPLEITHEELGQQTYALELHHALTNGFFVFEINMYEPKLFQDTTVESKHPNANNAYGAVAFIGKTKEFGEQWLYSRPDFSKIQELTSKRISKVLLHIPVLNGSWEPLDIFIPQRRFCSFGSTWNKRVSPYRKITNSDNKGRYLTIDVTSVFTNHSSSGLSYNEGLIFKKAQEKGRFSVISTGDCYSAPQILEIRYQ